MGRDGACRERIGTLFEGHSVVSKLIRDATMGSERSVITAVEQLLDGLHQGQLNEEHGAAARTVLESCVHANPTKIVGLVVFSIDSSHCKRPD